MYFDTTLRHDDHFKGESPFWSGLTVCSDAILVGQRTSTNSSTVTFHSIWKVLAFFCSLVLVLPLFYEEQQWRIYMAIGWFYTAGRNVDFERKNSSNSVFCWSSYFEVFYRLLLRACTEESFVLSSNIDTSICQCRGSRKKFPANNSSVEHREREK